MPKSQLLFGPFLLEVIESEFIFGHRLVVCGTLVQIWILHDDIKVIQSSCLLIYEILRNTCSDEQIGTELTFLIDPIWIEDIPHFNSAVR